MSHQASSGKTPDGDPNDPVGQPMPRSGRTEPEGEILFSSLRWYAVGLLVFSAYAFSFIHGDDISVDLFHRQDLPVIALTVVLFLCISSWPRLLRHLPVVRTPRFTPALLIGFAFVIAATGTWLVFGNFDLSRDEFMANFDAKTFASGRLAWPIPPEWRPFSHALMPLFMRDIPVGVGWISAYLPGNALLRALGERTIGREFTNPVLAAVAAFALFHIARKLWPETPRAALVPVLLLTLSPQFLVMAMTPFAMTAHLTFNLLWLLCFLQDNRRGDAAALGIGFFATGLHQLIFHPLFVAPFIVELLLARRFRRATVFVVGYSLIGLVWLLYPQLSGGIAGGANAREDGVAGAFMQFFGIVRALLDTMAVSNILRMLLNLLRFAAWQHMFLLALVFCSWPAIKRADGIARPLLGGILLLLVTASLVMPWQGNGWGYRYIHGFLGSFCLLAGYGWYHLSRYVADRRAALQLTTAVTVAVILPFQMVSSRAIVMPYRAANAMIAASHADIVLVDASGIRFPIDLIRNTGDLNQRPKIMDLQFLKEADLRALCLRYDVRLFDRRHAAQAGIPPANDVDESGARAILPAIGCDKPLPLSQINEVGSGR